MLLKISDHEPYSDELDWHGRAKGPLESVSKFDPSIVGALIEAIGKCDLLVVVSWQQADLISEKAGCETKLRLEVEWEVLPRGAFLLRHVQCGHHERILI